ncbi:MAG TPA: amidohydrolase family protein [Gemmatimonadaceae bacterium]|nr:amidohydrolase family protein [Gemmatimonadaceae bacterium]
MHWRTDSISGHAALALLLAIAAHGLDAQTRPTLSTAAARFVAVDAPIVALTHVRVVDGTGRPTREDQTILIDGARISAVGPAATVTVPASARVLDLTGHTVIPGLIGMHEHTYFATTTRMSQMSITAPRLYLANGVTTIRTTGSFFPYAELNMKRAIERGDLAGPRMHITGPYLDGGKGSASSLERHLQTEEETRRVVAYWASEGATWLKFLGNVPRSILGAGIDEAHKHGMKVTAHLCSITFREAAALGIDDVEHGLITDSDFVPGKQPDICPPENMKTQVDVDVDGEAVRTSFRELIARNVAVTSTLSVYELFVAQRSKLDPRALDALSPDIRREVEKAHADTNEFVLSTVLFNKMLRYDRAFVRAGGLLVDGVDPWGNGSLPGYGNLRNFELYIEAGFTPEEAIKIMTANGAKLLGELDQRGTIEVGKIADLAVIKGNPVRTASDIYGMTLVFRDGVGYDSAKLIDSVKGQVGLR